MSYEEYVSNCCKAPVEAVEGDCGTHPTCTKCGKPCNCEVFSATGRPAVYFGSKY